MPVGRPANGWAARPARCQQLLLAGAVSEHVDLAIGVGDPPLRVEHDRCVVQPALLVDLDDAAHVDPQPQSGGPVDGGPDRRAHTDSARAPYSSKAK